MASFFLWSNLACNHGTNVRGGCQLRAPYTVITILKLSEIRLMFCVRGPGSTFFPHSPLGPTNSNFFLHAWEAGSINACTFHKPRLNQQAYEFQNMQSSRNRMKKNKHHFTKKMEGFQFYFNFFVVGRHAVKLAGMQASKRLEKWRP